MPDQNKVRQVSMIWSVLSCDLLILICHVMSAEAWTQFQTRSIDCTQDAASEDRAITDNQNGPVTEQVKSEADIVELEQDNIGNVKSKEHDSTIKMNNFEQDTIADINSLEKGSIADVNTLEQTSTADANIFELSDTVAVKNMEKIHIFNRRKRTVTKLFGAGSKAIFTLLKSSQATNKLRKGATQVNTHTLFRIFKKSGGWKAAKEDFESVRPSPVYKFYNEGGHVLIGKVGDKAIALTQHGTNGKPEIKLGYDMKFENPPVDFFRYTQ